jgi:hypothetical protein
MTLTRNILKLKFLFVLIGFLVLKTNYAGVKIVAQTNSNIIHLKYGIFLKKIIPDFKENKFYAEFYWWTKFKNDSIISGFSNNEIMNLQYVNGIETPTNAISEEIEENRNLGNNVFYYTGFHQGYFSFNPEFLRYPFDKQNLNIDIEHTLLLNSQVIIDADTESYQFSKNEIGLYGISTELLQKNVSGLKVLESIIETGISVYNSNFGDPTFSAQSNYSKLTYSVTLDRIVTPYITKLFIPLGIILFLVYFVFFIPAEKLDMAAGLTVTSLLSAIAFQFTINDNLPEIGYLIYVDKIFYLTYALIVISMGESVITFYMDSIGNDKMKSLAVKIDKIFRFVFPVLFIVGAMLLKNF